MANLIRQAFVTKFPHLNPSGDTQAMNVLVAIIDDVCLDVGDEWPDSKRDRARLLLTAHRFLLSGALDGKTSSP